MTGNYPPSARREAILTLIERLAAAGGEPLTPERMAQESGALAPPPSAREIDVLLRMLLPTLAPRDRDGAWKLDREVINELLYPRLAELHHRARARARALSGRRGKPSSPDDESEDEGVWLFEQVRALADRVEARSGRLIHETDERLDELEGRAARASGAAALEALERQASLDAFLRNALYRAHWATRKMLAIRAATGADMLALLAVPPQALNVRGMRQAAAELEELDDGFDAMARELREIA